MLHAVCSVQTPKSLRHGGTGRDLDGVGRGAEERWERSRSRGEGMRGIEKQRGNGLTGSKTRLEKVKERVGEEGALWEGTLTYS